MKTLMERELRKKKKKIRQLKSKENWDVKKINELDDEVLKMEDLIRKEKIKFQEKKDKQKGEEEMTDEEYMEQTRNEYPITEKVNDHKIENNRENRRKKKKIIQGLNEDMLGKHMENQIRIRNQIVTQIKKEMEDSSNSSSDESSEEEKEFEKIRSEMYSHFKTV